MRAPWLLLALFCMVASLPSAGYEEETAFLSSVGLGHLALAFQEEEIEIHPISRLDDLSLRTLGVTTMGARMRLRDAATSWLANGGDPLQREEDDEGVEGGGEQETGETGYK
jgi:hypothetical protein